MSSVDALAGVVIGIIAICVLLSFFKKLDLSITLVLCNIVVFILIMFWPGSDYSLEFNPIYLETGENLYTILTSMFAHAGIFHLLGNMLFLILLGPALEQRIGKLRFAVVYFLSGIVATLTFSAVLWGEPVYLLGASGAISGIIGTFLVTYPRDKITMILGFFLIPDAPVWAVSAVWFLFNVVIAVGSPQTAWEAHLGGFLAGAVIGLLFYKAVKSEHVDKVPDISSLEQMATNNKQREAVEALIGETNPDIRRAWMEHFAENTQCPNCGSMMKWSKNSFRCNCGYSRKVK